MKVLRSDGTENTVFCINEFAVICLTAIRGHSSVT